MDRPTIAQLDGDTARYRLVLSLRHEGIATQIQQLLLARDLPVLGYWLANATLLALLVAIAAHSRFDAFDSFALASAGAMAAWLLLLPVHEHVHAFAYRLAGATDVSVHYQLRTLTAYCVADRSVVGGAAFVFVCLAPLVAIDALLAGAMLFAPAGGPWPLLLGGALLFHTGAASGDVALANLVWRCRGSRLWTYDDTGARVSRFFVATDPPGRTLP